LDPSEPSRRRRTWDGLPIAEEPPYACCVVVWRDGAHEREFLVLHRIAAGGPGFEGDWAWTPPSGARQPGEDPHQAAVRELHEETGLTIPVTLFDGEQAEEVRVFHAQATPSAQVVLDHEHDRFEWVGLAAVVDRCLPASVARDVERVDAWLTSRLSTGTSLGEDPPWLPWTPDEVAARLFGVGTRWYVVAGWAIDLFVGSPTRHHEDIEIGIPAGGFPAIRSRFAEFECDVVGSVDGGEGMRWPLESPAFDEHFQTWFREPATGVYRLDVFRDPHDGDTWFCRRDHSISLPYDRVIMRSAAGIPYMSPEIVLLFKAKHNRDKDRADLAAVRPLLTDDQVHWLREGIEQLHPGHAWLVELDR
jgi:8-oxo-dGTP pyrophosphatase MutT (NUDIX family)